MSTPAQFTPSDHSCCKCGKTARYTCLVSYRRNDGKPEYTCSVCAGVRQERTWSK